MLKVVCADDTFYNLETLRVVFENLGMGTNCTFVNDGKQAVQAAIKNVKDSDYERKYELVQIVIVDFEMPQLNGLEAVNEIKSFYNTTEPRLTNLPTFVMFSVHQFRKFKEYVLERGVDYTIQKPPNREEIYAIVDKAFKEYK